MLRDHFLKLGCNFVKNKISDVKKLYDIRQKLNEFLDKKMKENYSCSLEEELDFEGLVEYINDNFLDDMERRLFGNLNERRAAHKSIIDKAIVYSKGKTYLSEKRATKLISDAMNILRDFYKKRVNRELFILAAEIEDVIVNEMGEQHNQQTKTILKRLDDLEKSKTQVVSVDAGLELLNNGQITTIEDTLTQFTNSISAGHILFPHYGFQLHTIDGRIQYKSVPLSEKAIKEYPPSMKCLATVRMGDMYLKQLTPSAVDYANRHQLPIIIDVKKAEKYLGTVLDPSQHDAERMQGEEITISPKPFPPAFPCSIKFDGDIIFEYILLRTTEILDDNTIVISNHEQENFPYTIKMNLHTQDKSLDFTIQKNDSANNEESLKYATIIHKALLGAKMTVKLLESNEIFAEGVFNNFNYDGGFSSIEEEIDFLSRIISIEKYFEKKLSIPNEIYQSDWDAIFYISDLLKGETRYSEWNRHIFTFNVTDELKKEISDTEDQEFSLSYVGTANVPLWNETYELPIKRTFEVGKFENLENLKKKIAVLEQGDSVKVAFVTTADVGKLNDVLWTEVINNPNE